VFLSPKGVKPADLYRSPIDQAKSRLELGQTPRINELHCINFELGIASYSPAQIWPCRGVLSMKRLAFLIIALALASPAYASSSSVLFVGNNTGGVVNGAEVLGATTGNTPVISSQGSDTNIGLIFTTQGTGALSLETAGAGNVILAPGSGSVVIPAFTTSGIVFNNASGDLSSGTALPNGITATTQSPGDDSTKVATTAYVDSAITGGSGIKSVHTQVFTSSGTYTPTTGMAYAKVQMVGGGGAGGGIAASLGGGAGGGQGGAYSEGLFSAATIGASQTVTIGAAGTGSTGSAGSSGGTTSLGSLITAPGGAGAPAQTSGSSGYVPNPNLGGFSSSTGSGGYINLPGAAGGTGVGLSFNNSYYLSGLGGNGIFNSGGGQAVSGYVTGGASTGSDGNDGTGYGGGGSGAGQFGGDTSGTAGGDGSAGVVIITEYCTQ
jgi:hypothetical protein